MFGKTYRPASPKVPTGSVDELSREADKRDADYWRSLRVQRPNEQQSTGLTSAMADDEVAQHGDPAELGATNAAAPAPQLETQVTGHGAPARARTKGTSRRARSSKPTKSDGSNQSSALAPHLLSRRSRVEALLPMTTDDDAEVIDIITIATSAIARKVQGDELPAGGTESPGSRGVVLLAAVREALTSFAVGNDQAARLREAFATLEAELRGTRPQGGEGGLG